jgi:hypothetical protein
MLQFLAPTLRALLQIVASGRTCACVSPIKQAIRAGKRVRLCRALPKSVENIGRR